MPHPGSGNNTPHTDSGPADVRYVLAGQPTGWAAMAKEVREFDEEKVRSCKEDIDTLLVFAGLFSAVLSAFLVAAYPSLQPDRMDTVVYTLQVIATQTAGYKLTGDVLTAFNAPPSPPQPFEPATNDIRVNVLWFASLLTSLITASFAMLVKQWLREFLAVEIPSPQARLRLRHFREPQLTKWKVYEIAAALPLLLQLSLGLFLIGLCYFTAAIHTSIGSTALPLVIGWALFFFTATSLPICFPRCPYKTTLLKVGVAYLHRKCRQVAKQMWNKYDLHNFQPGGPPDRPQPPSVSIYGKIIRAALLRALPSLQSIPDEHLVTQTLDSDIDLLVSVDAIHASDELLVNPIVEALLQGQHDWEQMLHFVIQVLSHRVPTTASSDRVLVEWPFASAFPLDGLRPQVIEVVVKILFAISVHDKRYIEFCATYRGSAPHTRPKAHHYHNALCVLSLAIAATRISFGDTPVVTEVKDFLRYPLQYADENGVPVFWQEWVRLVLLGCQDYPRDVNGIDKAVYHALDLLIALRKQLDLSLTVEVRCFKVLMTERNGQAFQLTRPLASTCFNSMVQDYVNRLLQGEFSRVASTPDSIIDPETTNVLHFLVYHGIQARHVEWPLQELRDTIVQECLLNIYLTVATALTSTPGTRVLIDFLLHDGDGTQSASFQLFSGLGIEQDVRLEGHPIMNGITGRLVESLQSVISAPGTSNDPLYSAIRSCQAAMAILLLLNMEPGGFAEIRDIFASLGASIRQLVSTLADCQTGDKSLNSAIVSPRPYEQKVGIAAADVAHACIYMIHHCDRRQSSEDNAYGGWQPRPYDLWLQQFSEPESIFPDELVYILGQLDTDSDLRKESYRLRRLDEMGWKPPSVDSGKNLESHTDITAPDENRDSQQIVVAEYVRADNSLNAAATSSMHHESGVNISWVPVDEWNPFAMTYKRTPDA